MLPPVVNSLLESLPNVDEVKQTIPKLLEVKTVLAAAAKSNKPIAADAQEATVRRLDRALTIWRHKKKFASQYNKLCGLSEVARSLSVASENLFAELQKRKALDAQSLSNEIISSLLGDKSLLDLPPRQLELTFQVLEPMVLRLTANKLTPPVQRSLSEDALAAMTDEALEELPAEDNVISLTRRFINAIVRFAKSFQIDSVDTDRRRNKEQADQIQSLVDSLKQLEELAYDVCEIVNENDSIDLSKMQVDNRKYFEYLFPTEIITQQASPEMENAWREASLQRQIKSDMEDTLSDCVRSNPVANALMAEFAQTKELRIYEEARWMVIPEARKKMETRVATEVYNKANDEFAGKELVHRYPVEITQELRARFADGDLSGAMQVAQAIATEMLQRIVPEYYLNRNLPES